MHRSCLQFTKFNASFTVIDIRVFRPISNFKGVTKVRIVHNPRIISCSHLSSLSSVLKCYNGINRHYSSDNLQTELTPKSNSEVVTEQPNIKPVEEGSDLFDCIDYDEITGGDSDLLNKFKLLLLEVDVLRQDGMKVPSKLKTEQWKEMLSLRSRAQQRKFLAYLWLLQLKKINDQKKKERKRILSLERKAELIKENENNDHIRYGFQGNTIFLRVYDTTVNLFDNCRLVQAMLFGQNLVIDCGYEKNMSVMENKLCAKQLTYMFAENRLSKEPFNIHFCNMNKTGLLYKQFNKHIPTIEDPTFPINITEEHYMNLFPKERLVYLTPHCRQELKKINPDDIYIVGGLVDRQITEPLSLAKAKSEGLRMAQLPLDRYLDWGLGTKSLTINQVIKILHDAYTTGDWNIAFQNVPQRKIRSLEERVKDRRKIYKRGTIFQPPSFQNNRNDQPASFKIS